MIPFYRPFSPSGAKIEVSLLGRPVSLTLNSICCSPYSMLLALILVPLLRVVSGIINAKYDGKVWCETWVGT